MAWLFFAYDADFGVRNGADSEAAAHLQHGPAQWSSRRAGEIPKWLCVHWILHGWKSRRA